MSRAVAGTSSPAAPASSSRPVPVTRTPEARARSDSFREMGVAYVEFAISHRAHFDVMFRPDLHRTGDPELIRATEEAGRILHAGARDLADSPGDARVDGLAGWSIAHGFVTLWLTGALPSALGDDPLAAARTVLGTLSPPAGRGSPSGGT